MSIKSATEGTHPASLVENGLGQALDQNPNLKPASSTLNNENFAHQWLFGDKTIRLIRKGGDDLGYEITDLVKKTLKQGQIASVEGLTTNELIECLAESSIELDAHQNPHFKPVCELIEWQWQGKKVALVIDKEEYRRQPFLKDRALYWRLFDKATKTTSMKELSIGLIYNPLSSHAKEQAVGRRLLHLTKEELQNQYVPVSSIARSFRALDCLLSSSSEVLGSHNEAQKNIIKMLAECVIEKMEIQNNQLCALVLKSSLTTASKVNPEQNMDGYTWAITLIDTANDWRGHAALIMETIEDEQYHMYKTHLVSEGSKTLQTTPGVVIWREIDPSGLKYISKTRTWPVDSWRAEQTISLIKSEVATQNKIGTAVMFNARGEGSVYVDRKIEVDEDNRLVDVHNCITWAILKLRYAGIFLDGEHSGKLFITPKSYMKSLALPEPQQSANNNACVIL